MSTPIITERIGATPDLPDHAFRMVKIVETRKDANNKETHHLTVCIETLVDGTPTRTKVASLMLTPGDIPSLSWQAYAEQDL
ncbi:MAG: hypothetical protein ACFFDP_05900 [Promethearchaeota archaeon]